MGKSRILYQNCDSWECTSNFLVLCLIRLNSPVSVSLFLCIQDIMDEGLYDEFGNYIGGAQSSSESESPVEALEEPQERPLPPPEKKTGILTSDEIIIDDPGHDVVLYEDKRYYPESSEVYPEAETLIMEEDAQPITSPIIAPVKLPTFQKTEKHLPNLTFSPDFLVSLTKYPTLTRNIGFCGHLHHGKTSLVDILIEQTHLSVLNDPKSKLRYTDTREDEQILEISIKSTPISLILPDFREKSYLLNVIDTPGHPNFIDETAAAVRVVDGMFVVVDVVEGVTENTQKLIMMCRSEELGMVFVLNKMDRLALELKLPPNDAYYKIKLTLDQINQILLSLNCEKVSPESGNVLFASGLYGFVFNLQSFVHIYSRLYGVEIDEWQFSRRLWGDSYYNPANRRFYKQPQEGQTSGDRSFVTFILNPLYKLFGYTVSEEREVLDPVLAAAGVYVKKQMYTVNTQSLLKEVCKTFFQHTTCLVDTAVRAFPPPDKGTKRKIEKYYTGPLTSPLAVSLQTGSSSGPLLIDIVKLYHRQDCEHFDVFGRILSGSISKGQTVSVLGHKYSQQDPEDMTMQKVTNLWVFNARYRIEVETAQAGMWVLIDGVMGTITKCGTITTPDVIRDVYPLKPVKYRSESVIKVALEPYNPSELPKMIEGLRKCNQSYGLLQTKVEESGEHVLIGTGELMLDCVLHDLRRLYGEVEIKLSDPFVAFNETVIDTSSFKAWADTANGKNRVAVLAEPLEKEIARDIEAEKVVMTWPNQQLSHHFQSTYNWDILAARNIWAFGGPNLLLNDCLPGDADTNLLHQSKPNIVQGFQWACKEGPLCDEPLRNTKFRVIQANLASEAVYRASGQVIPAARRVCYSSFLLATPRLMEPYYTVDIQCTQDCMPAIATLLQRRRGHITSEEPLPGTPFYHVMATIPVIDSFGFETDLRTCTSGMAFGLTFFSHWDLVPGDPLDRNIELRPLEQVPTPHLAREFMVKTRRRKGLVEDLSVAKFFDDPALLALAREDQDLAPYLQTS